MHRTNTTIGTSITALKKYAESATDEALRTEVEAHQDKLNELEQQSKQLAEEQKLIRKHILSLEYVIADKDRQRAINDAKDNFKERLGVYKDSIVYQRGVKTDALCQAAQSLKYEFKLNPTVKAIPVMEAAGAVLNNNTPETRAKFMEAASKFENKNNKTNRFIATCVLFAAAACLVGMFALGLTGVGAIPALFFLVGSVSLFSLGLYLHAEYEQSRMEWAVDNFKYAAKPSFFASSSTTNQSANHLTPGCAV